MFFPVLFLYSISKTKNRVPSKMRTIASERFVLPSLNNPTIKKITINTHNHILTFLTYFINLLPLTDSNLCSSISILYYIKHSNEMTKQFLPQVPSEKSHSSGTFHQD